MHAEAYQNLSSSNLALEEKARLLVVTSEVSYGWLRAWPNTSLGTRLDDECVRTSVALALVLGSMEILNASVGKRPKERVMVWRAFRFE